MRNPISNLYACLAVDNRGCTDIEGDRPWNLRGDKTFHKSIIKDSNVIVLVTDSVVENSDKYFGEGKLWKVPKGLKDTFNPEIILGFIESNPQLKFIICGDGELLYVFKPLISKWYITHVEEVENAPTSASVDLDFVINNPEYFSAETLYNINKYKDVNQYPHKIIVYKWTGKEN